MDSQITSRTKFANKFWRLNNLYYIITDDGKKVKFRMNSAQEKLFDDMHYLNILLKARQFGGTTFIDLYYLDEVVFNPNIEAGIIAHKLDDAQKIFKRKIAYPYRCLPEQIRARRYPISDRANELSLNNNSTIYTSTSMRSGTVQYLHVSEYGYICAKNPEKALEIQTGALNSVAPGQMVWIESTSKGRVGHFYELWKKASRNPSSKMDWKSHFIAWFDKESNRLDEDVKISKELQAYFNGLEGQLGITLDRAQRRWYAAKEATMGIHMKQEYPSTPEEAFSTSGQMFAFGSAHIIPERPIPSNAPLYFTYDWGYGAPYSILYFWVDGDGRLYLFSEIYGQNPTMYGQNVGLRQTDEEVAEIILKHEKFLADKYHISFADIQRLSGPDCFSKKPDYRGGGQGPSTAEVFTRYGIFLRPGDPSRTLKIRQFIQRLRTYPDRPPMLQVYDTCTEFIRTIPELVQDPNNPEYIDTRGESHCFDSCCHVMMARPMRLVDPKPRRTVHDMHIIEVEKGVVDPFEDDFLEFQRETDRMMGLQPSELIETVEVDDGMRPW